MLNGIFVVIILLSVLLAAFTGGMEAVTNGIVSSAGNAVELALKLVGMMAFFLGLMKVVQDGGLLRMITRVVGPALRCIFPSVPKGHPAMNAMILNIGCNLMGLGNAATPFGIKAITELNRLNREKGTATDAMIVFLAINTSGLALLPTGVVSLRASLDSRDAAGIFLTTWFASGCATVVGILAALLLSRVAWYRRSAPPVVEPCESAAAAFSEEAGPDGEAVEESSLPPAADDLTPPRWGLPVAMIVVLAFVAALVLHMSRQLGTTPFLVVVREIGSFWVLPALVGTLVLFGWVRGVKVYSALVEGAKEGFQVAVRIIPYLVAIIVMVGMFRESGGMEFLVGLLEPFTVRVGLPAEALPVAVFRPFSGSGAYGLLAEIMTAHGPDSFIGYMVSTIYGSTETTFYVLAVYFGAVGIRKTRHALPACLAADVAGITAGVFIVNLLFG